MDVKSVLEMANGSILERADYEMTKIIDNLLDPNTDFKAVRELPIVLKFKIDAKRQNISVSCLPKAPKLAPTNPIEISLYVASGERGEITVVELTPQIPGQVNMNGAEQDEPVLLKLVSGGN